MKSYHQVPIFLCLIFLSAFPLFVLMLKYHIQQSTQMQNVVIVSKLSFVRLYFASLNFDCQIKLPVFLPFLPTYIKIINISCRVIFNETRFRYMKCILSIQKHYIGNSFLVEKEEVRGKLCSWLSNYYCYIVTSCYSCSVFF